MVQQLYHITIYVDVLVLGYECGLMLCVAAVPDAARSACHDALKVGLFCTAFRVCLKPVGRPPWREGKMGGGKERRGGGGMERLIRKRCRRSRYGGKEK